MPERTSHYTFSSELVPETACYFCSIPEIYAKGVPCRGGSASPFEYVKDPKTRRMVVKKDESGKAIKSKNYKNPGEHLFMETKNKVPKFYAAKTFKENPIRRLIGYEVEVNSYVDGAKISDYAKSIGGGVCTDCALEMQTPPANGDELIRRTKDISEKIRQCGAKCTKGSGLHTHVDCRDLSYEDMRKVCVLYGKTEGALYSIIDPRRCGELDWCKPIGGRGLVDMMSDPRTAKKEIIRLVYGNEKNVRASGRRAKDPVGGDRYLGFNLHSWFMRGTIEFRMHHGTTKHEKMLNWGMLLGGLVDAAVKNSAKDVAAWPVGKEGMLKYAPTEGVKTWVEERWKYFAAKRKNPSQPIL